MTPVKRLHSSTMLLRISFLNESHIKLKIALLSFSGFWKKIHFCQPLSDFRCFPHQRRVLSRLKLLFDTVVSTTRNKRIRLIRRYTKSLLLQTIPVQNKHLLLMLSKIKYKKIELLSKVHYATMMNSTQLS